MNQPFQKQPIILPVIFACLLAALLTSCTGGGKEHKFTPLLTEVAHSPSQWTGIALTQEGRMFINYPRWSDNVTASVAEITKTGLAFYPNDNWNVYDSTALPKDNFVCVQSLYVDAGEFLWILDAANPNFKGIIEGGAKLVKIDPQNDRVVQQVVFDKSVLRKDSYLNDVRVDAGRNFAYITDSGIGGLIVVDLTKRKARRVLDKHPSTHSDSTDIVIDGKPYRRPDGSRPYVHADGIELDSTGKYLYYHALHGQNLYRIDSQYLRDTTLTEDQVGAKVELVKKTGPVDGMLFDKKGNLYLSGLEQKAILWLYPDNKLDTLVQSPDLQWPDSFGIGPDGYLYMTTSQIHLGPNPSNPYRIYKAMLKP
ncbi:MAG: L-dopachrome tautomerase-related protein [Bacteroidota bacterium]